MSWFCHGAIQLRRAPHAACADFRDWAKKALGALRELRRTFGDPWDLFRRTEAAETFERLGLDAPSLLRKLEEHPATKLLEEA